MSTPASYFETMYEHSADPWHLAERWYERRKYDLTVAALPRPRYRSAFEPACSVGELTLRLAERCDALLACDRVPSAAATAAQRTAECSNVTVEHRVLPEQWPDGTFDLIVLSELLYYFDPAALDLLLRHSVRALEPGGTLITVHWNHPADGHLATGDDLAPVLARVPGLTLTADHREDDFVLQTFGRLGPDGARPPSPAGREGLT
ncbi:SAM-dependent methyltransferase [Streptomyces sp. NBC_00859]|uniref:SAM-dependent methyltransferase n=1 Tax=Streptomyces sp. NBC_00859 TaxID=2903682 RepID=UPI0038659F2E|nr:nodulation S family protein [Streptomyces sp. NBC_00859]